MDLGRDGYCVFQLVGLLWLFSITALMRRLAYQFINEFQVGSGINRLGGGDLFTQVLPSIHSRDNALLQRWARPAGWLMRASTLDSRLQRLFLFVAFACLLFNPLAVSGWPGKSDARHAVGNLKKRLLTARKRRSRRNLSYARRDRPQNPSSLSRQNFAKNADFSEIAVQRGQPQPKNS